jgi:hypothetical protein
VYNVYVFLLSILFKIRVFKFPNIDSPDKLYNLNVLNGLNELPLPLRKTVDNDFVFYQTIRKAYGVRITYKLTLISASVRYKIKKSGQITGFGQITKPYYLCDE